MRKVHLFLLFLALLGLSGCTETQKEAKQVLLALVRSHPLHQKQLVKKRRSVQNLIHQCQQK